VSGRIAVGVLGGGPPGDVDEHGSVRPAGASWHLEWWIGADDRWRLPTQEVAVRQTRVHDAPVVETAMRVPGGDAVARVFGVAGGGQPLVIEVENASPAPFVVAFVIRDAGRVSAEGATVSIDRAFALHTSRAPSRWACTTGTPVQVPVTTGQAATEDFPAVRDRGGRIEAAFLHPVAHRTTLRAALGPSPVAGVDPRSLPDATTVASGWARSLDRALRVDLPDAGLVARIDAARAEMLLRGQTRTADPSVVIALEDWGFDVEAEAAWRFLPARARRRAASREPVGDWSAALAAGDAEFLGAVRRLLVDDRPEPDASVALLRGWREAWRGQDLALREAPTRLGPVSVALRWHGPRAALLWDAPPGMTLTAPTLAPGWTTPTPSGETLLEVSPGAA